MVLILLFGCGDLPADFLGAGDSDSENSDVSSADPYESYETGGSSISKSEIDVFVPTLQPGASLFSLPSKIYSACQAEWDMVSAECTSLDFDLGYYYSFGFCDDQSTLYKIFEGSGTSHFLFYESDVCGGVTGSYTSSSTSSPTRSSSVSSSTDLYAVGYSISGGYDEYLGCWTCSEYDSESIHNDSGIYGSSYGVYSVRSSVSSYGSSYGSYSACNSYALYPPILVDGDNNIRGLLSVDKYDSDSVCYFSSSDSCQLLEFYCGL